MRGNYPECTTERNGEVKYGGEIQRHEGENKFHQTFIRSSRTQEELEKVILKSTRAMTFTEHTKNSIYSFKKLNRYNIEKSTGLPVSALAC